MARLRGVHVFLMSAALAFASGCVHQPKFSTTTRTADTDALKLDKLYVYSFLDFREGSLGKDFANSFEKQLKQRLDAAGVKSEFLWYKNSPVEATYSLKTTGTGPGGSSTQLPIGEVIRANAEAERAFDASHRLIIFPKSVFTNAGTKKFEISWTVLDRSGRTVWATKSMMDEFNYYGLGVNGNDRATAIVDAFVKEVRADGFLPQ